MQPNYYNNIYPNQYSAYAAQNPGANAVSINIISPQAYASNPNSGACAQIPQNGFYSMYGANMNPGMPYYPLNYNNMVNQANMPNNATNVVNNNNNNQSFAPSQQQEETKEAEPEKKEEAKKTDKKEKPKKITPLTDDYIKTLENYLNNDNPKVRLIGAKDLMERFKEDENRKDSPHLIPLLNKALKDTSSAVRFLALTTLQLGYSVGDDETVSLLKEIQAQNKDKIGEDSLLASEILLKLSAPEQIELKKEAE